MLRILARRCFLALLFFAWFATAFAAPTAPTGLNSVSLTATSFTLRWSAATGGSGGIAGYDIYRDGSLLGSTIATVRTIAVTGLAPTTVYSMTVVARDGVGGVSPVSAALTVTTAADTTVPTRPTDLAATAITTSSCTLTWTASTDNVGVTSYTIYRSGVSVGTSFGTTFEAKGLIPDTNNSLTVRAVDTAGNVSAASASLTVHTLALPPSVPAGLLASNLKATSFTLTWAASTGGTGGVASYDVYLNGALIGPSIAGRTYVVSGLAPSITYSMTVISRDSTGNVSPASAALEVTTPADTTVPTRPADLASANVTTTSFTLTWTGSTDNVGVTGYNIYRSGVQLGATSGTSYQVTGLIPDSTNNITVRASDVAGNLSTASVALSVRMVALPPSPPMGLAVAALRPSSFTLQWSASTGGTGGIKGYEVYLNGILVGSPTSRSLAVSGLAPQSNYSVTVTSHDAIGNISSPSEPLVVSTPADTTKPTVPKGLSADQVTPTGFTLTWTASTDNVGVIGYDVYRNNLLIGSTPTPVFVVSGLTPATLSSMRVKAKDASGNISGYSAILPVTTSALPNVPPTITLNSPADGSDFTLPFTLTLSVTAADSDGTIAKVEFFDNGNYLGETAVSVSGQPGIWLFTLSSQLPAGSHSLTARATDNRNATADSDAAAILLNNPNLLPTITITAPTSGTTLVAPGFVTIAADATDTDGTIAKVDFYEGDNLLGTVLAPATPPSTFTFPLTLYSTGTYTLKAVATDNSTAQASASVVINVSSGAAELPYVANFEPAEGYRPGPLAGQLSWVATGGVTIAPSATPGSQQELAIPAAQPAEILSRDFSAAGVSPVFVDFHARPVAGATPSSAMIFSTPAAQVALVGTSSPADLWIFGGSGSGWQANNQTIATDGEGRTAEWIRLTTREDYLRKKWDLYFNGKMIAADVPFADADAASLTDFSVNGHATFTSAFDTFYAGPENPLFADANHNGIEDTWETAHGLSLANDNRTLSPTGNGVTVLQAYLGGTDPQDFYNGTAPTLTIVSGDNQTASPGQFNAQPFVVLVRNAAGTAPVANAPVRFTVATGGGLLSSAAIGAPLATTLSLRTGADGTAQAYYQQPTTPGTTSQINGFAGTAQVTFHSASANSADTTLFSFSFEPEEGFAAGTIDGQNGWQIKWGSGEIAADAAAPSGGRVASIASISAISCNLPTPLSGQCTVDFYARLVAGANAYAASNFIVGEAGVALVFNGAGNEAEVYTSRYNDYAGVYGVAATGAKVPVDGEGRSGWHHFRFKLNFNQSQWDLYLDDALIAASRPMSISQTQTIQVINGTLAPAYFDLLNGSAVPPSPDSDGNGLPDSWEIQNFGHIGVDSGADPDGDGQSNLQEFQNGTDPNDYYNGEVPRVAIVSGDNQAALPFQINTQPLKVLVTNTAGMPLPNAPVDFGITAGAGLLRFSVDPAIFTSTVNLRTSDDGTAQVLYQQPGSAGTRSKISAAAASSQATFTTISIIDPTDTNGHGLPDSWQSTYFGRLGVSPDADTDGDGLSNLREFQLGTDPNDAKNNIPTGMFIDLGSKVSPIGIAKDGMVTVRADCTFQDGLPSGGYIKRWRGGVMSPLAVPPSLFAYALPPYSTFNGDYMGFWPEGNGSIWRTGWNLTASPMLNQNGWIALQTWDSNLSTNSDGADETFVLCWPNDRDVPFALKGPFIPSYFEHSETGSAYYNSTSANYLCGLNGDNEIRILMVETRFYTKSPSIGTVAGISAFQKYYADGEYGERLYNDTVSPRSVILGENIRHHVIGSYLENYFSGDVSNFVQWSPLAINDSDQVLGDDIGAGSGNYPLDADIYGSHVVQVSPGILVAKPFVLLGDDKAYLTGFPNDQIVHLNGFDAAGNVYGKIQQNSNATVRNRIWVAKPTEWGLPPETPAYTSISWEQPVVPDGYNSLFGVLPGSRRTELGIATKKEANGTTTTHGFILVPAQLAVDANRDGQIKLTTEDFSDLTTEKQPYRFWLNDDDDQMVQTATKDLVPITWEDWKNRQPDSARDMEDFARLWIQTTGLTAALRPKADDSADLYLGLQWTDTDSTNPGIRLFHHVETDGGTRYLTEPGVAENEAVETCILDESLPRDSIANTGIVTGSGVYVLPPWIFSSLSESTPTTHLLFEGCTIGHGQLKLVILKKEGASFTKIGDGPGVWFDLKNIKSMYERAVATTGGPRSENGVDYTIPQPYSYVGPDPSNLPQPTMGWEPNTLGFPYEPDPAETKTYVVYVHGWRWSPEKANNRTETVFKRLWHLGYKGRLAALRWPTFYGGPDDGDDWLAGLSTYNDSEYRAWKSGESLKQYVNQLPNGYTRSIVAHSMGNIVTGSALQKGMAVANYALLNGAIPAMCYDESSALHQPWNYTTPNDDSDSGTKSMAYTGQLKTLNTNAVNFFLTRDSATTFAWEINNDRFKPQNQIFIECVRGYTYARANPPGTKLFVDFCVSPLRHLIDEDEAMAFACQSLTKTVGAEGRTAGPISSTVDMDTFSFGDSHGAEWDRNFDQTRTFYIQLMRSLQLPLQP